MTANAELVEEQVLRKRPYLTVAMCRSVLADPLRSEVQDDGRIPTGAEWPCQTRPARASCGS